MTHCRECGQSQLVLDDVGSPVCALCGTLADPAQAVLADHTDAAPIPHAPSRTSRGWHLAQSKQDRDKRNTIAMNTFISAVLSRLGNPGLSPRAEALFSQARQKGHYRWGRKAKLVAGSAIATALREAHKSDALPDIAFLLDVPPLALSRTYQAVVSLLDLSLAATDPAAHLPILHAHLQSMLHPDSPGPSQLPKALVAVLMPLSLHAAVRTASSVSHIVSQHTPPLAIAHLPTPPTACACFILGLEAEARVPLPHLADLTRALASRFALAPGVVSSRYKILYDLMEERIRLVPWLDHFAYKDKGRGPTARSSVPKRAIVARGIQDIVQFHQQISHARLQQLKLDLGPLPDAWPSDDDDDEGAEAEAEAETHENARVSTPTVASASSHNGMDACDTARPPRKRRRIGAHPGDVIQGACRFLRDPLSAGAFEAATSNGKVGDASLLTYVLTCAPDQLSRARGPPPTRLQLLAAARGGSTTEEIADEELFAEGELEGLFRDEQEREALWPLFQLNWGEETFSQEAAPDRPAVVEPKRGAKRVNMDALARLLGGYTDGDSTGDEDAVFPDPDDNAYLWGLDDYTHRSEDRIAAADAELGSDWRPASSDDDAGDIFGALRYTTEDRYDEEL